MDVGCPASFPGVVVPAEDGGAGSVAFAGSSARASELDIASTARIASTFSMGVSFLKTFGATVDLIAVATS